MKILVVAPFGRIEPGMKENLANRARAGTHVNVECLEEVFPLPYNTYPVQPDEVRRRHSRTSHQGRGRRLRRLRDQRHDRPRPDTDARYRRHTGSGRVGGIGARCVDDVQSLHADRGRTYRGCPDPAAARLLTVSRTRPRRFATSASSPTSSILRKLRPKRCSAASGNKHGWQCMKDGAELIISGCTIVGGMMTQRYGTDQGWMLEGVPVIDGTLVAFKVAEMMVDLVALGYPPVSRFGFWARPGRLPRRPGNSGSGLVSTTQHSGTTSTVCPNRVKDKPARGAGPD